MSFQSPEIIPFGPRRFMGDQDVLKRPQQTHDAGKFFTPITDNLGKTQTHETSLDLARKADGFSSVVIIKAGTLEVRYRNENFRNEDFPDMLPKMDSSKYITEEARKYREIVLLAEAIACLKGKTREELGYSAVETAINMFERNGCKNKGPLHLHLLVFGVAYIDRGLGGGKVTFSKAAYKFIESLIRHGNGFLSVVEHESFRVKVIHRQLRFYDEKNSFVACGYESFIEYAKNRARTAGGFEGWVATIRENYVQPASGPQKEVTELVVKDTYGKDRALNMLKIKEMFRVFALALRVEDLNNVDKPIVYLYGKLKDKGKQDLRYLGNVSDNPVILAALTKAFKPAKLQFSNKEEHKKLYRVPFTEEIMRVGLVFSVQAATLTLNKFLTGIKIYGTRQVTDSSLEYSDLTDINKVADENSNGHWGAVNKAQQEYKEILADQADKTDFLKYGFGFWCTEKPKSKRPAPVAAIPVAASKMARCDTPPRGSESGAIYGSKVDRQDTPERESEPGPVPADIFRPPPRKHVVFVHESAGMTPLRKQLFTRMVESNGGKMAYKLDSSVTIIVTHPNAIARMELPGECTCKELKDQYKDAILTASAEVEKLLISP